MYTLLQPVGKLFHHSQLPCVQVHVAPAQAQYLADTQAIQGGNDHRKLPFGSGYNRKELLQLGDGVGVWNIGRLAELGDNVLGRVGINVPVFDGTAQRHAENPLAVADGALGEVTVKQLPDHVVDHGRGKSVQPYLSQNGIDLITDVTAIAAVCAGTQVRLVVLNPGVEIIPQLLSALCLRYAAERRGLQFQAHLCFVLQGVFLGDKAALAVGFLYAILIVFQVHVVNSAWLPGEDAVAVSLVFDLSFTNCHGFVCLPANYFLATARHFVRSYQSQMASSVSRRRLPF